MRKFSDMVAEYKIEEINSTKEITYKEGELISKERVINLFQQISANASNGNYRVGITCDPDRREKEHDAKFLAVISCPSVEKANDLEKMADKYSFDAGEHVGNAHCKKSKCVYIYKMGPNTKE